MVYISTYTLEHCLLIVYYGEIIWFNRYNFKTIQDTVYNWSDQEVHKGTLAGTLGKKVHCLVHSE